MIEDWYAELFQREFGFKANQLLGMPADKAEFVLRTKDIKIRICKFLHFHFLPRPDHGTVYLRIKKGLISGVRY